MAHELRNEIHTASMALSAMRSGHVGLNGTIGRVLDRSLLSMRSLIDRSLVEVRIASGVVPHSGRVSLSAFIAEVSVVARLEAELRGCHLAISEVDTTLVVDVDKELLYSAVRNLLQNAFKFTEKGTTRRTQRDRRGRQDDHRGGGSLWRPARRRQRTDVQTLRAGRRGSFGSGTGARDQSPLRGGVRRHARRARSTRASAASSRSIFLAA